MNTDWLYRVAIRLAPADRRDWVAAMHAESEHVTGNRFAWATGCLVMAFKQRMTVMIRGRTFHQTVIRYIPGGLVAAFGVALVVAVVVTLMRQSPAADHGRFLVPLIVSVVAAVPMISGGLAVIASDRSRLARLAGRWIFALGSAFTGVEMLRLWLTRLSHGPMTLAATGSWTPLMTGGLFIAAGLALLWGRLRAFLVLAMTVFAIQLVQWLVRLPAVPQGMPSYAYVFNFLGGCLPSLMLLAGTGLLLQTRSNRAVS